MSDIDRVEYHADAIAVLAERLVEDATKALRFPDHNDTILANARATAERLGWRIGRLHDVLDELGVPRLGSLRDSGA